MQDTAQSVARALFAIGDEAEEANAYSGMQIPYATLAHTMLQSVS
jgi:hypothetical protein